MRGLGFLCASVGLSLLSSLIVFAQGRSVAITVDDLPYAAGPLAPANVLDVPSTAEIVNHKLLAALQRHHVPVTGFVIQRRVESLGTTLGTSILKEWIIRGFD